MGDWVLLFRHKDSNTLRRVFRNTRLALLVSGLVAIVVVIVGFGLDRANTAAHLRELTIRTENEVSLIRARISAQTNMDITVVRDLANMVAVNSSVNAEEMERQINWLLIQNPHFLDVAIAPNFIVGNVFPSQAGKGRIGKDVREVLLARQAVTRASAEQARFYGPIAASDG
jgi:sensor domain CHASE-containing protein